MTRIIHYLQYLVFIFIEKVFNILPHPFALRLGKGLGTLFYSMDKRHRTVSLENLKMIYGTRKSPEEIKRISLNCFKNLGISIVEMIRLKNMSESELLKNVSVEGMEHYKDAIKKGRGLVFIGAHFGNWEMLAIVISLLFQKGYVVARKLDNPFIHQRIEKVRTSTGNRFINKNDAFWEMIKLLKKGELVGVLMDQNVAEREGVFVPFFGRPACTNKGLAMILLKTKTPMIPIFMVRLPNGTHRVIVKPELPLIHTGNLKSDVRQNTAQITRAIEEMVKQYPEQWLWMHRRWKTQNAVDLLSC
ncbi:MAG: lysophospholipid acyltransferase family protein [Nitrospiria bacterium]